MEDIPRALQDRTEGRTRILDSRVTLGESSEGEPAVFITLVLSGPPEGEPTWPVDDLWALRRTVRAVVTEVDPELETPWYLRFESENPEVLEPEDAAEQIEAED
jgi:hypothetical protein